MFFYYKDQGIASGSDSELICHSCIEIAFFRAVGTGICSE